MGKVMQISQLQREESVVPGRERVVFFGPQANGQAAVTADLLIIKPGGSAATHWHTGLEAHWFIAVRGRGRVVLGGEEHEFAPGCCIWVDAQEQHRLYNPYDEDCELYEFFVPGKWETHLVDGTPEHLRWNPKGS